MSKIHNQNLTITILPNETSMTDKIQDVYDLLDDYMERYLALLIQRDDNNIGSKSKEVIPNIIKYAESNPRQALVFALRKRGLSYRKIQKELIIHGYNVCLRTIQLDVLKLQNTFVLSNPSQQHSVTWTDKENSILQEYCGKLSANEIQHRFLRSRSCGAIKTQALKLGVNPYRNTR